MNCVKRAVSIALSLLLCTFSLLINCTLARAESSLPRKIRVGYVGFKGFMCEDQTGKLVGYGVDYLNEIARYANLEYEYVYSTWSDSLVMLQNKELDLVCTARFSPERIDTFEYSHQSFGRIRALLFTRPDNDNLYYDDFEMFDGMRVALMHDSLNVQIFEDYARYNNFSYTPVFYGSDLEMEIALRNGKVDAIATEDMAQHNDLKLIGHMGSEPFYLMSYLGNDFMNDINHAMREINARNAGYESELLKRYYSYNVSDSLTLTRSEAEFIRESGPLMVGQLPNRYPLSYYNEKTGTLEGINEDFMNKISAVSGLQFEYFPIKLGEKPLTALKSGYCDMVMGVLRNESFLNDSEVILSNPFFKTTSVVVTRKGQGYDPSYPCVAAVKTSFQAMQEYIAQKYPQYKILTYATDEECLSAIISGKADIMIQNIHVVNFLLQKPQYQNLEILHTNFLTEENCIMARSTADKRLMSIINKSIALISNEEVSRIILTNTTAKPYHLTTRDILYKYRIPLTMVAVMVLFCLMMLAFIMHNRQKNLERMTVKNLQLRAAVAQAEQANQAKGQFLSRMSHEIRTPINAIVGITEIARHHRQEPEKIKDCLDKIESSSRLLLGIINDVLDMSAIDHDKLQIASAPFDLKALLLDISSIYYAQCKQKGIHFEMITCDISQELLMGDALRTNQILLNLLSNACKFTDPGGHIRVTVSQKMQQDETVFMQFVVEDTGCGMTPDCLERLFHPFEQEDAQTALLHGGSGLGLAITKNLVDLMKGSLCADSRKGIGSRFTVDLPFKTAQTAVRYPSDVLNSLRALIIDEDTESRECTSAILSHLGVRHDVVSDCSSALELLSQAEASGDSCHVCLVDWTQPDTKALETIRCISSHCDKSPCSIIVFSSQNLSEIENEARAAGAVAFITKPLFQSTVLDLLTNLSEKHCQTAAQAQKNYDFSGKRVLLAEDNELNSIIITELLNMVQLQTDHAVNGKEAVELFANSEAGTYDAILMDIQMPVMDGYEAARAIRTLHHPHAKSIPILAMTANAFTQDISAALAAGMNGHIAKPIDTQLLYQTLEQKFLNREMSVTS